MKFHVRNANAPVGFFLMKDSLADEHMPQSPSHHFPARAAFRSTSMIFSSLSVQVSMTMMSSF